MPLHRNFFYILNKIIYKCIVSYSLTLHYVVIKFVNFFVIEFFCFCKLLLLFFMAHNTNIGLGNNIGNWLNITKFRCIPLQLGGLLEVKADTAPTQRPSLNSVRRKCLWKLRRRSRNPATRSIDVPRIGHHSLLNRVSNAWLGDRRHRQFLHQIRRIGIGVSDLEVGSCWRLTTCWRPFLLHWLGLHPRRLTCPWPRLPRYYYHIRILSK